MEKLRQPVVSYTLALCRAITSCRDLQRLLQLLGQAVRILLEGADGSEPSISDAEAEEGLSACRLVLLAAASAAVCSADLEQRQRLVRSQFYASSAFHDLSESLLAVVVPEWLQRMPQEQRHQLFDVWFERAPAAAMLPILTSHLSAVQPSSMPARSGRARVTAVSAEEAAAILAGRFAADGSTGVHELLQQITAAAAGASRMADATEQQQGQQAWQAQEEGLAAALASVPERAAAVELSALQPDAFVPAVSGQLLDLLAADDLSDVAHTLQLEQWPEQEQPAGMGAATAAEASHTAGIAFAANVLARFCRRGYQHLVAEALLRHLQQEGQRTSASGAALASIVIAALPDSAALDKMLEATLKEAVIAHPVPAVVGAGPGAAPSTAQPLPLDAPPASDPAAQAAAAVLSSLLPQAVWQARADARLLLTDKLLVQQQRRLLPMSALRGLLLFLQHQSPASGGSGGAGSRGGGLLPDAAARVAQLWGDAAAVQRLAPQQQAYLTAALCCCLRMMAQRELDQHPQLLQLLLVGITTRLDSMLLSVRRQAMRVGQVLSALLAPAKPPMFSEDAQLWQLLPEESWQERLVAPTAQQQSKQQAAASGGAAKPSSGNGKQGGSGMRQEAREQRLREQAKRQPLMEVEGPLTETDSDDELRGGGSEASSVTSSGTEGSTSSDKFEQYDLDESDDEDPARSRLQLRDLPKMLLSKAEEDWKGQLRALRHAEYIIRAAPDELEQYAVPLARALVHSKVPAWMDQEIPVGGPPANMQRFRDVVSLLVGVPESAGLALAAEMYGPSMDVHQRAMILDGMAAAAAEIARPGSSLPPLPGLHPEPPPQLSDSASAAAARAAVAAAGLSPEQQRLLTRTADGRKRVGIVTRIASRSLAAAAARNGKQAHFVNRFPPIALKWAAALLRHCDEPRQGVDLLGRDHFLLGKLLVTLGSFLEASTQSSEAATLAAATLELVRCGRVHNHPEPFVRRAALLAAGQVLGAVPPARLATSMLSVPAVGSGGGGVLPATVAARNAADEALISRLEWLRGWVEGVALQDTDDSCRMMAEGVRKLQGNLAAGALAVLDSSGHGAALAGGSLLPLPLQAAGGGMVGLPAGGLRLPDIQLP